MQYERVEKPNPYHKLTFEGQEVDLVRAAFREHIYNLAMRGNTGSIADFEANISNWSRYDDLQTLQLVQSALILDVLDDFAERTEEVVQSIPELSGTPAFQSDDIGERIRLGKSALALAEEIREKIAAAKPEQIEPEVEVSFEFTDEDARGLLGD